MEPTIAAYNRYLIAEETFWSKAVDQKYILLAKSLKLAAIAGASVSILMGQFEPTPRHLVYDIAETINAQPTQ